MKKIVFALVIFGLTASNALAAVSVTPNVISVCYPYSLGQFHKFDEKTLPSGLVLQNNGVDKVKVTNTSSKNFEVGDVRLVNNMRYNRNESTGKWRQSTEPFYLFLDDGKTEAEKQLLFVPTKENFPKPTEASVKAKYNNRTVEIKGTVSYFLKTNDCTGKAAIKPAGAAYTNANANAAFNRDLTIGSYGDDVVSLQTMLEAQGYLSLPAGVAKGYFGIMTKEAVAKFQAAKGVPATGYFGAQSRAVAK